MEQRKLQAGFSLMEILIVVAIVGIMSAAVIGGISYIGRARASSTKSLLRSLETYIDTYHNDTGEYPVTLNDLVERPSNEKVSKRWEGSYVKKVPTDGWKQDFVYQPTKGGKYPYELYSWGPNKEGSPQEEWISVWDL